jgi:hypothetical protein
MGKKDQGSDPKPSRKWVKTFKKMGRKVQGNGGDVFHLFHPSVQLVVGLFGAGLAHPFATALLGGAFCLVGKGILGICHVYWEFFCKDRPFFWFSDGFYVFLLRLTMNNYKLNVYHHETEKRICTGTDGLPDTDLGLRRGKR